VRDVIGVLRSQYLPLGIETFQFCFKISMSDQKGSAISNISISDLYKKTREIPLRRTAVSDRKFSKARIIMRNSGGKFRDFKVQFQKSLN